MLNSDCRILIIWFNTDDINAIIKFIVTVITARNNKRSNGCFSAMLLIIRADIPPREAVAGQQRAKHHLDPVVAGQIAHRDDVAEDVFEFYRAVVPRDVVDARQNDHDLRFQVDHVAAETG